MAKKTLLVLGSKRCLNQYQDLLSIKNLFFYDIKNNISKKHIKRDDIISPFKNRIRFIFQFNIDFIFYYKRLVNIKGIFSSPLNFYFLIYGIIGYFPYKVKPLFESLYLTFIEVLISKEFKKQLRKYKLIILYSISDAESFATYLWATKKGIETWFLPDGYDSLRKGYVPLKVNKYFSIGEINDFYYKSLGIKNKFITKINYPVPIPNKNESKQIALLQTSYSYFYKPEIIIKNLHDLLARNFPNLSFHLRKLPNSKLTRAKINLPKLSLKQQIKLKEPHSNYTENGSFPYDFNIGNNCMREFIGGTRILFLSDLTHAALDFYINGVPVIMVYDEKISNIKLSCKKDYVWEVFMKNHFPMITYNQLSSIKSIEQLEKISRKFKVDKVVNISKIGFISYLKNYI